MLKAPDNEKGKENATVNNVSHLAVVNRSYKCPEFGLASDYAYMRCEKAEFYYGYEKTFTNGVNSFDDGLNEEWCFSAKFDGQEIIIPFSKLKAQDQFNCTECILIGIGWILTKYSLRL